MSKKNRSSMLLLANWQSDVGYAWWLMESFWAAIAGEFSVGYKIILAYPKVTRIPEVIRNAHLQVVEQDFTNWSFQNLLSIWKFIRSHRVSVIYLTDWPAVYWFYPFFRLAGVRRIIVHDHTPGVRYPPRGLKRWAKSVLACSKFAVDAMISVTGYIQDRHVNVNCFPPGRCYVASNGIPLTDLNSPVGWPLSIEIPSDKTIMVMTGRASRYKGVDFILRCMRSLVHEHNRDNLHFLFCGDGPDLSYFRQLAVELNVADHVHFPGRCDDIPAILAGCDFAIHASLGEVGYSLSILEYMYSGLPVLVPDNPSVCGATTDGVTGLLYTEASIESAVDKILQLLDDPQRIIAMGQKAHDSVVENYRLENTHQQLLAAMHDILDQHRSGDAI